jgi:hypothetical protein
MGFVRFSEYRDINHLLSPLNPKRESERVTKDSRRAEIKRKISEESERRFISWGREKEHLV